MPRLISRREMLDRGTRGFGTLALAALLEQEAVRSAAASTNANPLAVRPPRPITRP